jgi:hypothetical protein
MRVAAFAVLSAAVLMGMVLAALHVRPGGGRARALLGLPHGGLGVLGLLALAAALRGATPDTLTWDAVALLVAAVLAGGTYYVLARRGRPPNALLVLHAAFGFIGYVLLAAYVGGG